MAPKKRDRCIKEVHLLQQLNHPHIITMFDAFIDQNQLIIITEWAPGGELLDLHNGRPSHACQSDNSNLVAAGVVRRPQLQPRVSCCVVETEE